MAALGQLLVVLIGSLAGFFAQFMVKKLAIGVAAVAAFAILTVAAMACISTFMNSILSLPTLPAGIIQGFAFFMPTNFAACIGALFSSEVCAAAYRWSVTQLKLLNQAA